MTRQHDALTVGIVSLDAVVTQQLMRAVGDDPELGADQPVPCKDTTLASQQQFFADVAFIDRRSSDSLSGKA